MRALTVAVTLLLALVAGCGEAPERRSPVDATPVPSATPTAPAAPTPSPEAVAALKDLQAWLVQQRAVQVSALTADAHQPVRHTGTADLQTEDFVATVELAQGIRVEMRRKSDMAWTRAPSSYWVNLGYTPASARAARGKWVAALAKEIPSIVGAMDPGALVRSLIALDPRDGVAMSVARSGPLRGDRVLEFVQDGAVQKVYLAAGRPPVLHRVTSTRDEKTTTVDFVAFPQHLDVRLPDVDDVLAAP